MTENYLYNLMTQLIQENKSLWRIKNHYIEEADCEKCENYWKTLQKDKETHVSELKELIKTHLND